MGDLGEGFEIDRRDDFEGAAIKRGRGFAADMVQHAIRAKAGKIGICLGKIGGEIRLCWPLRCAQARVDGVFLPAAAGVDFCDVERPREMKCGPLRCE